MEHFTRQETLVLTRSSRSQLSYLAKLEIVIPHRVQPHTSAVYYTWDQILEIRAINQLRQQISFQTIRKVLDFLKEQGFSRSLRDKQLIVFKDVVSWLRLDAASLQLVQLTDRQNKHAGQMILQSLPPWSHVLEERRKIAQSCQIIDFEQFRKKVHAPFT